MSPADRRVLELIAAVTERDGFERAAADTPALRDATDRLFALGYISIAPPGWCYRINALGSIALRVRVRVRAVSRELVA